MHAVEERKQVNSMSSEHPTTEHYEQLRRVAASLTNPPMRTAFWDSSLATLVVVFGMLAVFYGLSWVIGAV